MSNFCFLLQLSTLIIHIERFETPFSHANDPELAVEKLRVRWILTQCRFV